MSDAPGAALERRTDSPEALGRPLPAMDDGELASLYRTARALAESGLFPDAKNAGQAFAKIIAGRDLGLTPFEAMQQLHVMPNGKLEASSDLHATKVRQREGYDYAVWWIKSNTGAVYEPGTPIPGDEREAILATEEDPTDLREYVGCVLVFTVDGVRRGVSRWTHEDSVRAELDRDRGAGKKSNHLKFPRSMFFARAMTNGVAWYVPEVMGGLRVYGLGELEGAAGVAPDDLTSTDGPPARGPIGEKHEDHLSTEVGAIVARARDLGHVGLSNAEQAYHATNGQPAEVVRQWVDHASKALNALSARQRAGQPEPKPEPVDAVVVDDPPAEPAEPAPSEAVSPSDQAEGTDPPQEPENDGESAADVAEGDGSASATSDEAGPAEVDATRTRLEDALAEAERQAEDAHRAGDEVAAQFAKDEAESIRSNLAAMADPNQTDLGL